MFRSHGQRVTALSVAGFFHANIHYLALDRWAALLICVYAGSYNQDSSTSPLTLESSAQPSPVINLYPPGHTSVFNSAPAYSPDNGGPFYAPTSNIYSHQIDPRSRLGSRYVMDQTTPADHFSFFSLPPIDLDCDSLPVWE